MAKPPTRVKIRLEPKTRDVAAGGRARFRLRIDNPAIVGQTVVLRVQEPDADWNASLPMRLVRVAPGSAVTLFLRVDAPMDAAPGQRQTFQVLASGAHEPERAARLDVEVVVAA